MLSRSAQARARARAQAQPQPNSEIQHHAVPMPMDSNRRPKDAVVSWLAARGFPIKGSELRTPLLSKRPGSESVISTAMFEACADGNLDACQWLLAQGCQDDARAPSRHLSMCTGERPMHVACANGHADVVHWLCTAAAAQPDLEAVSAIGETPLWAAAAGGHFKVVQLLCRRLGQKQNCRTANARGQTPLFVSCARGYLEMAQWLFVEGGAGGDISCADDQGCSPLAAACRGGHLALVQWLILEGGASRDMSRLDYQGNSPFAAACRGGHLALAQWLRDWFTSEGNTGGVGESDDALVAVMDPGGNSGDRGGGGGVSPFYAACAAGQLEVARWLWTCTADDLNHGGNGHGGAVAHNGQEPLHFLLANAFGDADWTPFTAAVADGHHSVAEWLLARSHDLKSTTPGSLHVDLLRAPTRLGLTPLHVASFFATRHSSDGGGSARGGWLELLRWLLQVGAANDHGVDGACGGHSAHKEGMLDGGSVSAFVLKRDLPYAPLRHALRATLVAHLLEHRAFVKSLLLSGGNRGRLRGHEQTLLPLIASYLGLLTGRQLRNVRQAAALL